MNLANIAAGLVFTTGLSTYTTMQLQDTLNAVREIEYEQLEDVTDKTSMRDAIKIVNRNNMKRRALIFKLDKTLKENLRKDTSTEEQLK